MSKFLTLFAFVGLYQISTTLAVPSLSLIKASSNHRNVLEDFLPLYGPAKLNKIITQKNLNEIKVHLCLFLTLCLQPNLKYFYFTANLESFWKWTTALEDIDGRIRPSWCFPSWVVSVQLGVRKVRFWSYLFDFGYRCHVWWLI